MAGQNIIMSSLVLCAVTLLLSHIMTIKALLLTMKVHNTCNMCSPCISHNKNLEEKIYI